MHALLNDGLDKVLCRMRESLIFATLYEVSIIFWKRKFYKCKESIKIDTKPYKWKKKKKKKTP